MGTRIRPSRTTRPESKRAMVEIPMVAYGTLRPNPEIGWNRDRGRGGECREPVLNVRISGRIYDHGFPVAKLDEEGQIVGDVLFYENEIPEWIVRMEEGAGYELRPVEVRDESGRIIMDAVAWHYCHQPRGKWIKSGDFLQHKLDKAESFR